MTLLQFRVRGFVTSLSHSNAHYAYKGLQEFFGGELNIISHYCDDISSLYLKERTTFVFLGHRIPFIFNFRCSLRFTEPFIEFNTLRVSRYDILNSLGLHKVKLMFHCFIFQLINQFWASFTVARKQVIV